MHFQSLENFFLIDSFIILNLKRKDCLLNNNEYVKKKKYIQHLKIILKGILLIDQPINRQLSLVPCNDIFLLSVSIY